MIDVNKTYWLYIAPYVYCCIKEGQSLLFNTDSGACMETDNCEVIHLLQLMHEKKNLGAILCEGKMLARMPFVEFISEYCEKNMGAVVDVLLVPERPIQMMPFLNLQHDVDNLLKIEDKYVGEGVLRNLLELNIYINNVCNQCCSYCNSYFQQSLCCHTNKENNQTETLSLQTLKSLLSQIRYGAIGKLNLLGGNIFNYPYYKELPDILSDFKGRVHLWNHYAGFAEHPTLDHNFIYDVVIPFPLSCNLLDKCFTLLEDFSNKVHFYVTCIEEYDQCTELVDNYQIDNYSIHPVYIGTNKDFFEEYVYMDKKDILQSKTSFNQIFARQKMNTNNFGKLTVLENGDVLAGVNNRVLGNLQNDKLLDIVNMEMHANTAWRKTRDGNPCINCLYQYLCPSPSPYEIAIGKNNLCHVPYTD